MKTVFDVANYFIFKDRQQQKNSITPKKLQKLLYYAQASSLAFNDTPLFLDDFEAWEHGAVVPCVYRKYSDHKYQVIDKTVDSTVTWVESEKKALEAVWQTYGHLSAKELEDLNHSETPWKKARGDKPSDAWCNEVIPKQDILSYQLHFVQSKENYMYSSNITNKTKSEKIEFRFSDNTFQEVDRENAEEFIIENISKFEKKKFSPKGVRRVPV